jgi:glycine/D-amino acid oxidase-like deaminating enzyme
LTGTNPRLTALFLPARIPAPVHPDGDLTTEERDLRTGNAPWTRGAARLGVRRLVRDIRTEILVVGAGISDAFMAEALSTDHQVVVIDRRGPARGSTAASTALIAAEIDQPLTRLALGIGRENARRVWRRSALAVQAIAARAAFLGIEGSARLVRRDSLYLAGNLLGPGDLEREGRARRAAGLPAIYLTRRELDECYGIRGDAGLLAFGNLAADPVRLATGHLRAAIGRGTRLYAPAEASALETSRGEVVVATAAGPTIRARQVIFCTGYELPEFVSTDRGRVVSTYAFATRPQTRRLWPTRCMIWEAADPYLYVRDTPDGRVVCGGEDEDFADAEARDALIPAKIRTLRRKLARRLPGIDTEPEQAWAGNFGETRTGLPILGALPRKPRCFAVLGFGGNGTTYSRIAADVIATALAGGEDADADLFAFRSDETGK